VTFYAEFEERPTMHSPDVAHFDGHFVASTSIIAFEGRFQLGFRARMAVSIELVRAEICL